MILLTRLNNRPFTVNSDLIKFIEQSPDTVITLVDGEKLLVLERADEVRRRIVEFRRAILQGMYSVLSASVTPPVIGSDSTDESRAEPAGR